MYCKLSPIKNNFTSISGPFLSCTFQGLLYLVPLISIKFFLQDLEGREESDSLQNLLYALTSELDLKVAKKKEILSVEDLLNKPFYTVESTPENELNLETENYRELLPKLLLSVKIKEPLELQNVSVGERMQSIDWNEEKAKKFVQNTLLYGEHNSLCLEHGRKHIISVSFHVYFHF